VPQPQYAAGRRPSRALRLLIADDNRDDVAMLSALLSHEGHQVVEVYRADAVLQLTRRYKPDAVLLDIGMPGMTGFEIARQLRDELGAKCPPLIAVTAWGQNAAKEMGKLVGFSRYLVKPYEPEDLLATLASL
jgi:CheY-like chemotaxis protein